MKKKVYLRKWGINIFLVFCIVGVSIYYSTGQGVNVFNGVLKNRNNIPIHSVDTNEKIVSVTINTAYGKQFTKEILDVLEKEDVKSSFFSMGSFIERYESDIKNIYKKGHEIANNSSSYPHFTKISSEQMESEIKIAQEKIKEVTGSNNKLFRPPFGDYNGDVLKKVSEMGYTSIMWDVDSLDLSNKNENEILDTILKQVTNGSILLFHNNSEKTPKIMEMAIKELKAKGYKFVKVSELIYKDDFYIDHSGRQKQTK